MKLGTITFWNTEDNYGQVLQCFALIKYLEERGHEVELIRTDQRSLEKQSYLHKFFTVLSIIKNPQTRIKNRKNPVNSTQSCSPYINRSFSEFKRENIPYTEKIYDYEALCKEHLEYDAVICGSDQIWSGFSKLMFLQFPGRFKRISYAASFGGRHPQNYLDKRHIETWLKSLDLVTVRETEGQEICQQCGVSAYVVPDPTLLLERNVYSSLMETPKEATGEQFILLYLLGNEMAVNVAEIEAFSKAIGIRLIYVASQNRMDDFEKYYPTVGEWLYLIEHATYVITNSFHGTVFSLLFHRPFLTIPLSGDASRMNGRIEEMLAKYDLKDRIYDKSFDPLISPIDFSSFDNKKGKETLEVNRLFGGIGL